MTNNMTATRYQAEARAACLTRLNELREAVKNSDVQDWSGDFWHVATVLEEALAFLENHAPRNVQEYLSGDADRLARRVRLGSGMPLSR